MRLRLYISGITLLTTLVAVGAVFVLVATPPNQIEVAPPPIEEKPAEHTAITTPLPEEEPEESATPQQSKGEPEGIRLRAPRAAQLKLDLKRPTRHEGSYVALALYFRTSLFARPAKRLDVIGFARRGARLPVERRVSGAGCKGSWYLVQGGGYVCTSRGFLVGTKPKMTLPFSLPNLDQLLPHRYGKVTRDDAERLFRIPTPEEDELIANAAISDGGLPDIVEKSMKGIYFVAVDHEETSEGRAFYRTVRGRYVRKEDVELRPTPQMYGEWLTGDGNGNALPLAFVYEMDRPVYRLEDSQLREVGVIEKHARFRPARTLKHDGRDLLQTDGGYLVDRSHVRLVDKVSRPADIPSRQKWIHVDLKQQTLVAYKHNTPMFATLVSSGKEGFEPPLGVYRIHKKYVSTTMNGPDPDDGWYEVEEVPWTMYYWESYALHGTYWHNNFGKSRSHGCTNLAPADAKWLFYWTDPDVPGGWHAREKRGTRVYFTK